MKRFLALLLILSFAAPALAQAPLYPPRIDEHRTLPPIRKTQLQIGLFNFGVGGGFRGRLESQQREIDNLRQQLQNMPAPQPQILQAPPGPSFDPQVAAELRRIGDILLMQQQKPLPPVPGPIAQIEQPAPINIYLPQPLPVNPPTQPLPVNPPYQPLPVNPPTQPLPVAPPTQPLPVAPPSQPLPQQPQAQPLPAAPGGQPLPQNNIGPPTGYQRFTVNRYWVSAPVDPNVWRPVNVLERR